MPPLDPIRRLIRELGRLPGIGEKSATRLAFHLLQAPASQSRELAEALVAVRDKIRLCSRCCNLTEADPCSLCADARRDGALLCVVSSPSDLLAVDKSGHFRGSYHVLHGVLAPLDGIGPEDLRITELMSRLSENVVQEVILATNPNVEGEATAAYLARLIKPLGIRVTRIASGIPIGSEIEYVDQVTLSRAIDERREV